ncbi:MAG: polysaccharide deacetylase family protein [Candidatus Pacearchaeota archaeon]
MFEKKIKKSILIAFFIALFLVAFCPSYSIKIKNPGDTPIVVLGFDTEIGMRESTIHILNFLKENNISATFFVNGDFIEQNMDVAEMIANSTNELASHSHVHVAHNKLSRIEQEMIIDAHKKLIEAWLNKTVIGFRAPYRMINKNTLEVLAKNGFEYSADYHCFNHLFIFPLHKKITPHATSCTKSFIYIFPKIFGYPIDDDFLFRHSNMSEEQALKLIKQAFDSSSKKGYIFIVSMHPNLAEAKINFLKNFIDYAKSKNAIFMTHAQIQEMIKKDKSLVEIKYGCFK